MRSSWYSFFKVIIVSDYCLVNCSSIDIPYMNVPIYQLNNVTVTGSGYLVDTTVSFDCAFADSIYVGVVCNDYGNGTADWEPKNMTCPQPCKTKIPCSRFEMVL